MAQESQLTQLTITEALAELKTLKSRVEKKATALMQYFARDSQRIDPLAKDGGTEGYWRRETQAITDLQERLIAIRAAIQRANQTTEMTVLGLTRTIGDWLTWRREVAPVRTSFFQVQTSALKQIRKQISEVNLRQQAQQGQTQEQPQVTYVLATDELALLAEAEALTELIGALDGKLSLINATTTITIPM